jgi:hypothetical protein
MWKQVPCLDFSCYRGLRTALQNRNSVTNINVVWLCTHRTQNRVQRWTRNVQVAYAFLSTRPTVNSLSCVTRFRDWCAELCDSVQRLVCCDRRSDGVMCKMPMHSCRHALPSTAWAVWLSSETGVLKPTKWTPRWFACVLPCRSPLSSPAGQMNTSECILPLFSWLKYRAQLGKSRLRRPSVHKCFVIFFVTQATRK